MPFAIGRRSSRSTGPCCCAPGGQTARDGELQLARSICGIRWTPAQQRVRASAYYAWIAEGLALFGALAARGVEAIEVFPTASWTRWHGTRGSRTRAGLDSAGTGGPRPCWRARAHEPRPARRYRRRGHRSPAQPGPDGNDRGRGRARRPLVTWAGQLPKPGGAGACLVGCWALTLCWWRLSRFCLPTSRARRRCCGAWGGSDVRPGAGRPSRADPRRSGRP